MIDLKGKKLLVVGGAFQHCKVVEAAHELGVEVIVDDYLPLEKAPAKQLADKYYTHNITDIDGIVEMCREEHIDGVIALCLDACQRPYQKICEKLKVPCFGTKEQFHILTDKIAFKRFCIENGVDVIPEYDVNIFLNPSDDLKTVEYPVLVKPCDSRGSRGSTVCNNYDEVRNAIEAASSESSNGTVLIEKYMGNKKDLCITYIIINGKAYLTRVGDRVLGSIEDKMERVSMLGMAPSQYTQIYVDNVNSRVIGMLEQLGLENAPVFMQGFLDGNTIRFYDPGLRFPGAEYERLYERVHDVSLIKPLIEFALTGKISDYTHVLTNGYLQNGKKTPYLLISLRPGKIAKISGVEEIQSHPAVVAMNTRYQVGDQVGEHYNVNQRFCEIDLLCDNMCHLSDTIAWIYNTLIIEDEDGNNMVFSKLSDSQLEAMKNDTSNN